MTKKLYLCLKESMPEPRPGGPISMEEIFTYKWFSIDPVEGTDGLTTFMPPALNPLPNDQPDLFGCCALGSEIYVVGGVHYSHWGDDEPYVPGRHPLKLTLIDRVLVCDVNFPISGWKEMPDHMKSKRARPQVCVIDEKIYVFGSNMHPLIPPCNPWAEVFDRQKGWKTLDDPPLELFNYFTGDPFETLTAINHAVFDKNDIAVRLHSVSFSADLCFKTKSLKWEDMDPRRWPYELFCGRGCQKYVVLDDSETKHQVVYAVINGDFCTCKLDQQKVPKMAKIPGLEEVTKSIKGNPLNPSFLFHLENLDFCLVWSVPQVAGKDGSDEERRNPHWPVYYQLVHCVNFHLSHSKKSGSFIAVVEKCRYYIAPGFDLLYCLELDISTDGAERNDPQSFQEYTRMDSLVVEQHVDTSSDPKMQEFTDYNRLVNDFNELEKERQMLEKEREILEKKRQTMLLQLFKSSHLREAIASKFCIDASPYAYTTSTTDAQKLSSLEDDMLVKTAKKGAENVLSSGPHEGPSVEDEDEQQKAEYCEWKEEEYDWNVADPAYFMSAATSSLPADALVDNEEYDESWEWKEKEYDWNVADPAYFMSAATSSLPGDPLVVDEEYDENGF